VKLRTDYAIAERAPFEGTPWVASPEAGVERKMLERDGDEIARATSIVRYRAGSRFGEHVHALGEEFLVLEGTFSDEHGDYGAGTYVRNPPGTRHAPFSAGGCTIFVKLRQFADGDVRQFAIGPGEGTWVDRGAASTKELHAFGSERVALVRLAAGGVHDLDTGEGRAELLVLEGELDLDGQRGERLTWLRTPRGGRVSTSRGCTFWVKRGHPR
jgi:quercetin dioxygenase-like cupin family protein